MHAEGEPYPPGVRIGNRSPVDDVFGEWPSFHDQYVTALRITNGADDRAQLELDIDAAAGYEQQADGTFAATEMHRVTLRCHDVDQVLIDSWQSPNIIGELRISAIDPDGLGGRAIFVEVEPISGCCAEVRLVCRAIEVVGVESLSRR